MKRLRSVCLWVLVSCFVAGLAGCGPKPATDATNGPQPTNGGSQNAQQGSPTAPPPLQVK